jgi:hypothetical protein
MHYRHSFGLPGPENPGSTQVSAVRLEGREHRALQVIVSEVPSAPDTGESSQFFAMRNGLLRSLNYPEMDVGQLPLEANAVNSKPSDLIWLRIRVDGKEGYILGEDDFRAIGLVALDGPLG